MAIATSKPQIEITPTDSDETAAVMRYKNGSAAKVGDVNVSSCQYYTTQLYT